MNSKNVHIASFITLGVILALGIISVAQIQNTNAQIVLQNYPSTGRVVGTANQGVVKIINMHGMDQLSFILTTTTNFSSTNLAVDVSVDNSNFVRADTIALGTAATYSKSYGEGNFTKTINVNPALFPYVKIASANIGGSTQTLTYSAR